VRVNDPAGLLPPGNTSPLRAPNLIIGVVFGDGAFLGADNTGVDAAGRDYQMSIPTGVPLKLWAFSRHVTLTDSRAAPVDNSGARIPVPGRRRARSDFYVKRFRACSPGAIGGFTKCVCPSCFWRLPPSATVRSP
jgi:hypothetical protein